MREQVAPHIYRRASATKEELLARRTEVQSANPHRAGHYAGLHPEDQPYTSGQVTRREPEYEEDDSYYPQRMPTSTRRYDRVQDQEVYTQGNRRLVIHREPPPKQKRRHHWLLWIGVAMMIMLAGWVLLSTLSIWWVNQQNTWSYGYPRTFQTDAVVFKDDTPETPTHVIALNLNGKIEIFVLPQGQAQNAKIFVGPDIYTSEPSLVPVTVSFKDVDGSGRLAMIVHVGDQSIVYLNDGTQFKAPKQ